MPKFVEIDLLDNLEKIMKKNTQSYQGDFWYDRKELEEVAAKADEHTPHAPGNQTDINFQLPSRLPDLSLLQHKLKSSRFSHRHNKSRYDTLPLPLGTPSVLSGARYHSDGTSRDMSAP